jgi:hypothetical protein
MASITSEQKDLIREWAAAGATLNDIQSKLKNECAVTLTYMETRLLVMELGVSLQDKPREKQAEKAAAPEAEGEDDMGTGGDEAPDDEAQAPAQGVFKMEADELMVPGTLASGSVTFSEGTKAKWFLDQMGRLSLKADQPGFQPPPADVPLFQRELEKILVKLGLY